MSTRVPCMLPIQEAYRTRCGCVAAMPLIARSDGLNSFGHCLAQNLSSRRLRMGLWRSGEGQPGDPRGREKVSLGFAHGSFSRIMKSKVQGRQRQLAGGAPGRLGAGGCRVRLRG